MFVELSSTDTKATIRVNGRDNSKDDRGFNIVILDYTTGEVIGSESFNTQTDGGSSKAMANFINSLKPATIILAATRGNAELDLTDDGYNALVSVIFTSIKDYELRYLSGFIEFIYLYVINSSKLGRPFSFY